MSMRKEGLPGEQVHSTLLVSLGVQLHALLLFLFSAVNSNQLSYLSFLVSRASNRQPGTHSHSGEGRVYLYSAFDCDKAHAASTHTHRKKWTPRCVTSRSFPIMETSASCLHAFSIQNK